MTRSKTNFTSYEARFRLLNLRTRNPIDLYRISLIFFKISTLKEGMEGCEGRVKRASYLANLKQNQNFYLISYYFLTYTGDRYWYENGNAPGSFTIKQLEEIRKSTMAQILCRNGDRLQWMQPRAFILKDPFL